MEIALLPLQASYSAIPEHVQAIVATLPVWARRAATRVGLAEALGNAIVHGTLRLTPRDETTDLERWLDDLVEADVSDRELLVLVHAEDEVATIVISDRGPGFDWRAASPKPQHGLGIMNETFDEVAWNARGNVVALRVHGRS